MPFVLRSLQLCLAKKASCCRYTVKLIESGKQMFMNMFLFQINTNVLRTGLYNQSLAEI